jgi:hypothetical protein
VKLLIAVLAILLGIGAVALAQTYSTTPSALGGGGVTNYQKAVIEAAGMQLFGGLGT